jgi:hypothetical protein
LGWVVVGDIDDYADLSTDYKNILIFLNDLFLQFLYNYRPRKPTKRKPPLWGRRKLRGLRLGGEAVNLFLQSLAGAGEAGSLGLIPASLESEAASPIRVPVGQDVALTDVGGRVVEFGLDVVSEVFHNIDDYDRVLIKCKSFFVFI